MGLRRWIRKRLDPASAGDSYDSARPFLGDVACPIFLDGGAHVGSTVRRTLEAFPGARVFAFEPTPESFLLLESAFSTDRRVTPVRAALGAVSGRSTLFLNRSAATNSLLTPEPVAEEHWRDQTVQTGRIDIDVVSLDDWATESGLEHADVIKLDLQGFELEALRGARRLLSSGVRVVLSEAQLTPLYRGAALFADLDRYLRDLGFDLFRIQELHHSGPERRTTYCDAVWVLADLLGRFSEPATRSPGP